MTDKRLGIALVGLGTYSEQQLGPALKETKHCELRAVVSGNPGKLRKWQSDYNLEEKGLYSYDNFDSIKDNDGVDIVYVVLPNALHAEYVIRAAKAGKHVICEKPLATNVDDCRRMIDACKEAGVKFSVGYRLHFEPFNREMMRLGQQKVMGSIQGITAENGMDVGEKNQWRLKKDLAGGGPLMDLGIYCVQGVIYTVGDLPVAVTAEFTKKEDAEKFNEVEEGLSWEMEFENGITAKCKTSYSREFNTLKAEAENGWFGLEPAYEYKGLKGNTSEGRMNFPDINEQAAQMDDFAHVHPEPTRKHLSPEKWV